MVLLELIEVLFKAVVLIIVLALMAIAVLFMLSPFLIFLL
jgi:hypothetical protein